VDAELLRSSTEFATELASHLAGLAEPGSELPSDTQLAALIDATFFASLHDEEARRVEFGVAWEPKARDCAAVISLASAVRVTPKNLAKLAPATWGEATAIAVRVDGDELVAWALIERSLAIHQPLIIRALGAGVLLVEYAGAPRALYSRGEIRLIGGTHRVKSPARALSRTFSAWATDASSAIGVDLRAAVVTRIASRVLAHGHGGMILLVPATVESPIGVRAHYAVRDGADVLVERYARVVSDVPVEERLPRLVGSRPRGIDGRASVRDEAQIAFAEAIEQVARLTAIDNALLLDTDLRIRGFGVQVIEGDVPRTSFRHVNPYTDDVHVDDLSTFKGTRHPAGVLFCMRHDHEAAAIIASQDGNLSLVIKDARGDVEVIGSYQHTFGWK